MGRAAAVVWLLLLLAPALGLHTARITMAAVSPPSKVMVVGGGPLALLASKAMAKRGFETMLVTSETALSEELLWDDDNNKKLDTLRLIDPAADEDVEAFENAVGKSEALCVAYDASRTLDSKLLDVVMPQSGANNLKRVVLVSRHLNGKGQGLLTVASKAAANKEVWALTPDLKANLQDFEKRVAEKADLCGADLCVVRVGTLKGGGPGTPEATEERLAVASRSATTLTRAFYAKCVVPDLVNWQLLFDCGTQGVTLTPGDSAVGPGLRAVFTSTSPEPEPGDSGRVATAQALALALSHPDAGGKSFGVNTAASRTPPSDAEWEQLLGAVLSKTEAAMM